MSVGRLVAWTFLWLGGWALFLIDPASHSDIGTALLIGAAAVIFDPAASEGPLRARPGRRGDARRPGPSLPFDGVRASAFVHLAVSSDPLLVSALKVFGVAVAVLGIGVNWRQFTGGPAGA